MLSSNVHFLYAYHLLDVLFFLLIALFFHFAFNIAKKNIYRNTTTVTAITHKHKFIIMLSSLNFLRKKKMFSFYFVVMHFILPQFQFTKLDYFPTYSIIYYIDLQHIFKEQKKIHEKENIFFSFFKNTCTLSLNIIYSLRCRMKFLQDAFLFG